jgi:hypothetical protein
VSGAGRILAGACALALAAILLVHAPLALAAGGNERFVVPDVPGPPTWKSQPDPQRPDAKLLENAQNAKDKVRIESLFGAPESLAEIRMALDAPGKASCASFDTTTLQDHPTNGYPRLIWRTDCTKADGTKGTFLNLAVRGREALHLAMKIWQFEVPEAEVGPWLARFEQAYVCDPRGGGRPCPAESRPSP